MSPAPICTLSFGVSQPYYGGKGAWAPGWAGFPGGPSIACGFAVAVQAIPFTGYKFAYWKASAPIVPPSGWSLDSTSNPLALALYKPASTLTPVFVAVPPAAAVSITATRIVPPGDKFLVTWSCSVNAMLVTSTQPGFGPFSSMSGSATSLAIASGESVTVTAVCAGVTKTIVVTG